MGLALLGGISCKKQAVPQEEAPAFKVVSSTLVIPAKGGQASIAYEATKAFTVSVDKTWCTAEDEGDQIVFTAAANEDLQSRYTVATVSCGGKEYKYTIQQFGFNSSGFEPSDIRTSALAAEFNFPYAYDEMLEAATDASWITLTVTKNNLHVAVAENTTVGSPEDPSRVAEIAWHLGVDTGVIKVTQSNVSFMKQDDNWSVYYDGVKPYKDEDVAYIYNDVTDPAKSGLYSITYVSKSEFEQSGMEMDDYAMVVGDNLREDIKEAVEFYQLFYPDITFADFLYEDSDFEIFDPMEAGDYIAFAVGFTADEALSGHYQYSEFTVKGDGGGDNPGDPTDVSGTWYCASAIDYWGEPVENWTMTITKSGSSFSIAGFDKSFDEFLSNYDLSCEPASAKLNGSTLTVPVNSATGIQADGTPVVWVGLNDNNQKVDIEFIYDYVNNTLTLSTENYGAYVDDPVEPGFYSLYAQPLVFKRTSGGNGGGGDTPGGDEKTGYNAWLGEWESVRGASTDTWKITALVEGSTYTITGIEGKDFPVTAIYDSSTKGIEVHSQDEIGTYTSSTYGECSVGFYGGWGESSFATGTYVIFTGSMNGNEVSLTQGEVKFSDGSSHVLERAQFVAATSDGKYLTLTQDKTPLPTTLTRKGQGGGDQGGSEKYNKWLGNWNVASENGDFAISLSQKTADKSFNMLGWQMEESFFSESPVEYNADGTITLFGSDDDPIASNVNIGAPEGPCDLFYVGKFIHSDGREYYITSNGESYYDVATGTIQSDGTAKFTGNKFELSDGGEYTFSRLEIIAVPVSDPEGGVYTFQNKPSEFPLSASKASGTAKKMNYVEKSYSWQKTNIPVKSMASFAPSQVYPVQVLPYNAKNNSIYKSLLKANTSFDFTAVNNRVKLIKRVK